MKKDTGGPAFPFEYHNQTSKPQPSFFNDGFIYPDGSEQYAGMTLRDYFATKALCGDWASQNSSTGEFPTDAEIEPLTKRAQLYYRMADAMLKARGAE